MTNKAIKGISSGPGVSKQNVPHDGSSFPLTLPHCSSHTSAIHAPANHIVDTQSIELFWTHGFFGVTGLTPNACSVNASDAKCNRSAQNDAHAAITMMIEHPVLIHVPVNTGATGINELRRFYAEIFIPQMPPDLAL